MPDVESHNDEFVSQHGYDHPEVTHSQPPQPSLRVPEGLKQDTGVGQIGQGNERGEHAALNRLVELAQVFLEVFRIAKRVGTHR